MSNLLERQADFLLSRLTPRRQRTVGLLMIYIALPLHVYGFFTSEPFFIYQMSAMAITTTGITAIIASVPSTKADRAAESKAESVAEGDDKLQEPA